MDDTINCAVCDKPTSMITPAHLRQHGMTVAEYKERFPLAPMASPAIMAKRTSTLKKSAADAGKTVRAPKEKLDPLDSVSCAVCGKSSKQITHVHVKMHGMTMGEYRERFPDAPLSNIRTRDKVAASKLGVPRGEEFAQKMSESRKGQIFRPSYVMDDHTKTTISKARLRNAAVGTSELLGDKDALVERLKSTTIRSLSRELNVHESIIYRRLTGFGVDLEVSSLETLMRDFLSGLGVEFIERSRKIIPPKELDFYVPSHNFAIEICGLYWHSDRFLASTYHRDKWRACREKGIRLVTIFEDEINDQFELIKSRIGYFLGKGEKGIGARKHRIERVDASVVNEFYDRRHIQRGAMTNHINYAAFVGDEMTGAMSFRRSWRFAHKGDDAPYELTRFATDGRNHAGLASKLLRVFRGEYDPHMVITYADHRWSNGDLYESMGMVREDKIIQPSYSYFRNGVLREDKNRFRLKNIRHLVENGDTKTEREIMNELGYKRIYDCGYTRFVWTK